MSGRRVQIDSASSGASRTITVPAGARGAYFHATQAFSLQIDGEGDSIKFPAGAYTPYLEMIDVASVTLSDQAATDLGHHGAIFVMGKRRKDE